MDFYRRALELKNETVSHRRYMHTNAESGMDLPLTKEYIWQKLTEYGISPQHCGKGITALIGHGEPVILLRADMDALPMAEDNSEDFSSRTDSAHTCGHDFHAAMLLCAAKMLKEQEAHLCGSVKLMFQPGEEVLLGCRNMLENGLLENPRPTAAFALHVAAGRLPLGVFMYNSKGAMMNSCDNFRITVKGKGGHGAYPHLAVDPINIAVHIYTAFQSLVATEATPTAATTLTVGRFAAGDSLNIIPDSASLEGSIRTDDPICRSRLKRRIEEIVYGTAKTFGGSAEVEWLATVPPLICSRSFTEEMVKYMLELPVPANTPVADMKASASEDFACIAEKLPSAMFYISAGYEDERGAYSAHNPKVLFNEDVCATGAAAYAHCAVRWLEEYGKKEFR